MASWTLFCRASRVRWSTGSTDWISTLLITSPFWLKRRFDRTASFSSKPNTAEQMIRFEFYRQKPPVQHKKQDEWVGPMHRTLMCNNSWLSWLTDGKADGRILVSTMQTQILHASDKSNSLSLIYLVEIIKLYWSHSSSDPGGNGFTGVAHKVRHWEESCCLGGVWLVLYLKVPAHEKGENMKELLCQIDWTTLKAVRHTKFALICRHPVMSQMDIALHLSFSIELLQQMYTTEQW